MPPVPQLLLSPAQGCLILPLSFQDPAKETLAHFSINITPHTYTGCAQHSSEAFLTHKCTEYNFDNYERFHGVRFPEVLAVSKN